MIVNCKYYNQVVHCCRSLLACLILCSCCLSPAYKMCILVR